MKILLKIIFFPFCFILLFIMTLAYIFSPLTEREKKEIKAWKVKGGGM